MICNQLEIVGLVQKVDALRYTPAGIPILSLVLQHASEQIEAGMKRKVECEINAVIIGDLAKQTLHEGTNIKAIGFIAKRSLKSTQLVLHIKTIEFI